MSNTTSNNIPNIFKTKNKLYEYSLLKKSLIPNNKSITDVNSIYKFKHYPPYIKEWVNSVYCFNINNVKTLPSLDINIYNLIKSYFNFYILKYNNITRTRGWRVRRKKSSIQRLIASKPSIKHTNDKINVTVYTYDKSSPNYIEKIADMSTIDQLNNQYDSFFVNLKNKYISLEDSLKNTLKNKDFKKYARNAVINKHKLLLKSAEDNSGLLAQDVFNIIINNNISPLNLINKDLQVAYNDTINSYIKKIIWDDIVSIFYKQCLSFEQSKYEKQHAQLLTNLLENIYKKKVVLDIVNLKYFYNSSSIFSSVVLAKLKMKKNKVIDVLSSALDTFNIPPLNRIKVYNETYNRRMFKQNVLLKKLVSICDPTSHNVNSKNFNDIDISLCNNNYKHNIINIISKPKQSQPDVYNINLEEIINSLKNKFTKGIRIEAAGRLTKRNIAERSVYKVAYKGNLRNQDSSMKGLPTVLLRGHAKSNLVYTHTKSRLRVGSFGLKTWISSE